jgi:PHD/YefM family antitoxin component YafN of YafNO toxin-antitoxin module
MIKEKMEAIMESVSVSSARENIYSLIGSIRKTGAPMRITSKTGNVVLVSEEEWRDIEETLYLMSNKATYEAIKEGLNTPVSECVEEIDL